MDDGALFAASRPACFERHEKQFGDSLDLIAAQGWVIPAR
jgi:hypothetical protein